MSGSRKGIFQLKEICGLFICYLLIVTSSQVSALAQSDSGMVAAALRCEYLVAPLAVDAREPRLSWMVESNARGAKQTAYQVLVASTAAHLAAEKGDLWDTGKVASSDTIQIA